MHRQDGGERLYQVVLQASPAPGWLWYYFIVQIDGQSYYYGNNTDSLGGIGQLYEEAVVKSYQITVYKTGSSTPQWLKEAVIYQIFIDRFYSGEDRQLPAKQGAVFHADWSNTPFYIRDPDTQRIIYYDFFGGNLDGVSKKLDYLKELGVTVIYFNPLFEAPSNHRYDTSDYHKIDSVVGDNKLFAEFCVQAAEMGIAVILDGVFSHTGSDSIYFNREGRYPGLGAYQSTDSPYYNWYNFANHPDDYQSWWGIDTLPNVKEDEPSYLDFVIDNKNSVLKYWLKQGVKGWRLDVADELPDSFIKHFAKTMKTLDPNTILIGEVWEEASHKFSQGKMREYLNGEELDSVMNYPFRHILLDFILESKDAYETQQALMSLYENYPRHNFYSLMNLLGSHDVVRILTLLGEAPPPESMSSTEQAKYRLSDQQRRTAVARLKLLVLWQMTFPGVPSIYYGDEAGLEGYADPFNRGTYPWGHEDQEMLSWYKTMTSLRHRYDMLKTGEWLPLYAEGDIYGYIRRICGGADVFGSPKQDGIAIVIFNRSKNSTERITVDTGRLCRGMMADVLADHKEYCVEQGKLTLTIGPLEGKILVQVEKPAFKREAGILLHPTSLPSKHGIGDIGKEAFRFIDLLRAGKQKLWQVLPLNPVGISGSPYQSMSAFAGNSLLISLEELADIGLLTENELNPGQDFDKSKVDFGKVGEFKEGLLRAAFANFLVCEKPADYDDFLLQNSRWLDDYVCFAAFKKYFNDQSWHLWPTDIANREPQAIERYTKLLAMELDYHRFVQYNFFRQWTALKTYASKQGVKIIGDLAIFVDHDSCDVWANRDLFELDESGLPTKVAGVPPDYFSTTGQLWGHPHYRWVKMAEDDYAWWRLRVAVLLQQVQIIRIDHFRGFAAYWEVLAGEQTAVNGKWVLGPGVDFFEKLQNYFGVLPIIAEDLGIITAEVEDLKNQFNYPGMNVLQFTLLPDEQGKCAPFICEQNIVVYTGTHDNETTVGWYKRLLASKPEAAKSIGKKLGITGSDLVVACWKIIKFAYASNANTVIIPLQDVLGLGNEAKMNTPGVSDGNWQWRYQAETFTEEITARLAELVDANDR